MDHLTEEQLEDLLQGTLKEDAHLEQCSECRERLMVKKALAGRLRQTFADVTVSSDFAERLRERIRETSPSAKTVRMTDSAGRHHWRKRVLSGLAAAAVLMIVAIPVGIYISDAKQAQAAQRALVEIHDMHVNAEHGDLQVDDDPEKLAAFLKEKLGFRPRYPILGQGLKIRGCCVDHFHGDFVGSYIVDTPSGVISIIVVTDTPKELGMKKMDTPNDSPHMFWQSSYAHCHMVTVQLDEYSYCAVGEIEHEPLYDILHHLLP